MSDEPRDNAIEFETLLGQLEELNISETLIERTFELTTGTIERWRNDPPPEALALLRMVCTLPWLLEIAEYKFDLAVARYLVLERAARLVAASTADTQRTPTSATSHGLGNDP